MSKSLVPRRLVLRGGVLGAATALAPLAGEGRAAAAASEVAAAAAAEAQEARSYDFNQGWLFGGRYVTGAELPGHDDTGFTRVTLPHTVTRLSWADWAYPPVLADLTLGAPLPDLRVDGYVGTTLAVTLLMSADSSKNRLGLAAGASVIVADGSDATLVVFRATDEHGNHRSHVTGDVTLTVTGPGRLVGSNPFPFGTLGGVGGAFVRSIEGKAGR